MASPASRIFLLRKGITQRDLAAALGVHECTISLLLSGEKKIETRLDQIADYLGISREKLDALVASKGKKRATPKPVNKSTHAARKAA
ncbi:MAG: helix-turn-helix domain-containing protein [Candidatus Binatia bacterium]